MRRCPKLETWSPQLDFNLSSRVYSGLRISEFLFLVQKMRCSEDIVLAEILSPLEALLSHSDLKLAMRVTNSYPIWYLNIGQNFPIWPFHAGPVDRSDGQLFKAME